MWLDEAGITHKVLPDLRVATIKTEVKDRIELKALFGELKAACGKAVSGGPLLLWYTGTGLKGMLVEAAYPVSRAVRKGRVTTRDLAGGPAYTALHRGPIPDITVHRRYVSRLYEQGIVLRGPLREVYLASDPAHPEDDSTELQFLSHEWTCRLARGIEAALGPKAEGLVMQGVQALGPASTREDRYRWVKAAMERLDDATRDEDKKYPSVSGCADGFPPNRLEHLREVYLRRRSIDDVLEDLKGDNFWYADPVRKGGVIYETKLPVDQEGHKRAETREERRKAYCHCVLLNHFINEGGGRLPHLLPLRDGVVQVALGGNHGRPRAHRGRQAPHQGRRGVHVRGPPRPRGCEGGPREGRQEEEEGQEGGGAAEESGRQGQAQGEEGPEEGAGQEAGEVASRILSDSTNWLRPVQFGLVESIDLHSLTPPPSDYIKGRSHSCDAG